jgi:hypothetical protein
MREMATAEKKKRKSPTNKETSNPVGRPPKFANDGELQDKVNAYFESCFEELWEEDVNDEGATIWKPKYDRHGEIVKYQKEPFTITGLALYLDTTRETISDYEYKPEFSDTIKRAKGRIENFTERQLFDKAARNMTGIIFNLKNNYGWTDKTEVDNNIGNKDGKPFETKDSLKKLSPKELAQLESILTKTADSG